MQAFATLVEELDHLLLIAERSQLRRPVSLLELELHANVTKELVLTRFLAGSGTRLRQEHRVWLRHQLFEGCRYCDEEATVRARYREAARWAVRFLNALVELDAAQRLRLLRRFHALDTPGKIELIGCLAA